jgi:hypothetical protein
MRSDPPWRATIVRTSGSPRPVRDEAVAPAGDRVDPLRRGRVVGQRAPQLGDAVVDGTRTARVLPSPQHVEQPVAREQLVGMGEQVLEQCERLRRQVQLGAGEPGAVRDPVEPQRATRQRARGGQRRAAGLSPPQHGADARHELAGIERLVEVVVGALLQRHRLLARRAHLREQDHGVEASVSPQPAQDLAAVDAGHEHVEHDQVGIGVEARLQRGLAVAGDRDGEPGALEERLELGRDGLLVVGQQDDRPLAHAAAQHRRAAGAQASMSSTASSCPCMRSRSFLRTAEWIWETRDSGTAPWMRVHRNCSSVALFAGS